MMNAYNKKGTQFLKAIKKLVKDEQKENCDVLFKTLESISLKDNLHLGLKVAVHEGMGDESSFYTYKGDKDPYRQEELHPLNMLELPDIFPDLKVEKSEMGAWQVYLLYMSPTVLPVFWHGGYIRNGRFSEFFCFSSRESESRLPHTSRHSYHRGNDCPRCRENERKPPSCDERCF